MIDLDARLLAAHEEGNLRHLVALYAQAADEAATEDAAGFYLTQAYIYALDCGDPAAATLHARLLQMGREAALEGANRA